MIVYSTGSDSRTVTPGLLHFAIFLSNFLKNTVKIITKSVNYPGLLHFF